MSTQNTSLTRYDEQLLGRLRLFPQMDKASQDRLRKEIDIRRMQSKAFDEAFGGFLSGQFGTTQKQNTGSLLKNLKDTANAILHPIESVKGKAGEVMLKQRNKAPKILVHPHGVLSEQARPWDFSTEKKEDLVAIVRKLGAALRGVDYGQKLGIAAPQIGISRRIFVCQGAVCVNPEWEPSTYSGKEEILEGCYSVPDNKIYKTQRWKRGWGTWYSIDGTPRRFKLKGNDAVVFQHELDHLDGKCCCDIGVLYTPEEHAKS